MTTTEHEDNVRKEALAYLTSLLDTFRLEDYQVAEAAVRIRAAIIILVESYNHSMQQLLVENSELKAQLEKSQDRVAYLKNQLAVL